MALPCEHVTITVTLRGLLNVLHHLVHLTAASVVLQVSSWAL
jgi:hypothetical protein